MKKKAISVVGVASLIEQAARLLHSSGHREGLYPAQWTALRYFSEAPESTRTQAGLAKFQDMHLGPVARTVRGLLEKGLLIRQPNPKSRRADLIEITPLGVELLKLDPRNDIVSVLKGMPVEYHEALALAMSAFLQGLHQHRHDTNSENT